MVMLNKIFESESESESNYPQYCAANFICS